MNEMGFIQRAKMAAQLGFWAITGGRFEGHEIDRRRYRTPAQNLSQDADLNLGVREALMDEARKLAQTVPIVERILRQYANYVVGSAKIQFRTGDEQWNRKAERQFNDWAKICDVRGVHNLRSLARLGTVSELRDGDFFINEIDDGEYFWLESIEADRVTNSREGPINIDEENVVGGVKIGSRGDPTHYRVCDRVRRGGHEFGTFKFRDWIHVSQMSHLIDPMRADAYRGVTAFKTVLNHVRDWKQTLQAEKTAQGVASRLALIVKNNQGGIPAVAPNGSVNLFGAGETTNNGTVVPVEEISEGVIKYMFPNEDIQAFMSSRPGDGWFTLALLLIRDIAIGLDLPFEFVWDMAKLNGTATRLVSKQAERTFENKQQNLEDRFLNRIALRWVTKEMEQKRLPFNPDYTLYKFQRPAHPSVDAGRDSTADIAEIEAGVTTEDTIANERGHDGGDNRTISDQITADRVRKAILTKKQFEADAPEMTVKDYLILSGCPNAKLLVSKTPEGTEGNPPKAKNLLSA